MELTPRTSTGAEVERTRAGWRLSIPAGVARHYRLAQLDNCTRVARRDFSYSTLDLRLRARASTASAPGTWGFGVWNDPYRLSLGPGENLLDLLTLPNAAWFFHSSPESYLTFRDDKPGQGFLAQVFRSAPASIFPLVEVAGTFLVSRPAARRRLSRLIQEDAVALELDPTQWHAYRMNWIPDGVLFEVDGAVVLETRLSPEPPLAGVIWIDNQFAAFTPQGRISFGTLGNPAATLEIESLELKA